MNLKLALLLAIAFVLFGCVDERALQSYYRGSAGGEAASLELSDTAACPTGDCVCMVCEAEAPPDPYSSFFPFSFAEKSCSLGPCTQQTYESSFLTPGQKEETINFFMLGQGGFSEFNRANPYCNNSLRFPVKWLDSRNGQGSYPLPDAGRASCFLEKGSIPTYILYSRGENISADRAGEIAGLFRGKGPVIITTEMEFNSSNASQREAVRRQAVRMKEECPDCLIALAPRIWDNSTEFDQLASSLGSSFDLFAFGINSHDSTSCDPAVLYYDATSYSEYLLYEYKKPSVWAYILFDRGESADGSCEWDDTQLTRAYSDFYTYAPGFVASGVLGASLYSLYGIGPLPCENCSLFGSSGEPELPVQPAWFSNCQEAAATGAVIPLVFSNAPGTVCAFGPSFYSYAGTSFYTTQPIPTEPAEAAPTFYSCDSCLIEDEPSSVGKSIRPQIPGDYVCTDYPVLDVYADIRDIDPAYVRATVWHESDFDRCSVGHSTASCGRREPIYYVTDPDTGCLWDSSNTFYAPRGDNVCDMGLIPTFATPEDTWEEIEWESFMDKVGGELDVARSCRAEGEEFNPFNPTHIACEGTYELAEDIRDARRIIERDERRLGLTRIRSAYGEEEYQNAKGLLTVFLARLDFIGDEVWSTWREDWMDDFSEYSQITDSYCSDNPDGHVCCDGDRLRTDSAGVCCGSTDFIEFVTNEACMNLYGIDLGKYETPVKNTRAVLSRYLGVREKCGICDSTKWEENIEAWAAAQD
ncbi:MAG: hypothetical protein AB1657_05125 [Candidatus Micrarchaeota archaeon]